MWSCGIGLPRDGIGFVFDRQDVADAALIPSRTTLYACSWAIPRPEPTEGPHGDGNHHGPEHDTTP